MPGIRAKTGQRLEFWVLDQKHRKKIVELFIADSCATQSVSEVTCDFQPQLMRDHSSEHEGLHMINVALAIERFVQIQGLFPRPELDFYRPP